MSSTLLPAAPGRAMIADLECTPEKAELINGRIVRYMPTGYLPNVIAGRVYRKLAEYAESRGSGDAFTDMMGFTVPKLTSGRESFAPDAAFYEGPLPENRMKFVHGAPQFAVEVRSENDYGPAAEKEMADKRADYFEAGTLVVWDVDPEAEMIHLYAKDNPTVPIIFVRGELAHAEPAVPGWTVSTEWLFA